MKKKTVEFALTRKLLTYAEIDLPDYINEKDEEAIKKYISQNWNKVDYKMPRFGFLDTRNILSGSEEIIENKPFTIYEWYDDLFGDIFDDDVELVNCM